MAKGSGGGLPSDIKTVLFWGLGIGILALTLLILSIIFGNLSGNVGFAVDTQGYNDTQNIITNYTQSAVNTAKQFPTTGTILGIALLLAILIGVLVFAIRKMMGVAGGSGGGSNASFG